MAQGFLQSRSDTFSFAQEGSASGLYQALIGAGNPQQSVWEELNQSSTLAIRAIGLAFRKNVATWLELEFEVDPNYWTTGERFLDRGDRVF